jgi:zinc protease
VVKTYYGPSNAVIVLAVTLMWKRQGKNGKVLWRHSCRSPLAHQEAWIAKMSGVHRQVVEDRVPEAKIFKVWNIPGFATTDGTFLEMGASMSELRQIFSIVQTARF